MKKSIWAIFILCLLLMATGCGRAAGLKDGSETKEETTALQTEEPKAEIQKQDADPMMPEEVNTGLLPHEYPPASGTEQGSADAGSSEDPSAGAEPEVFSEEPDPVKSEESDPDESEGPEDLSEEPSEDSSDPSASETISEDNNPEPEEYKHPEYPDGAAVVLDPGWEYADFSVIHSGAAVLYRAQENRRNIIIGVNAGHGTAGGESQYTYCHPDYTPKVTGGTNAAGSVQAMAVSSGMTFFDGTPERDVNERTAQILKELLLQSGYDVLMIRDGEDVQLDNIARTLICNHVADCHIAIHFDGDGLDYDKGCFYMSVADGIKGMYPVSEIWWEDDRLGDCLIAGLSQAGAPVFENGSMQMDLTQTSFSSVPSVDIELGNAASAHSDEDLYVRAAGLLAGVDMFFAG